MLTYEIPPRYVDEEALRNGLRRKPKRKPELWGLQHIATGLYLDVQNRYGGARYSMAEVPTLKRKSTISYWHNRMRQPEAWRMLRFTVETVPVGE